MPAEMLETAKPVWQVNVTPKQLFRTKMFSTPLLVFPKLDASDEKAMNWPDRLMLGCSLKPLAILAPRGASYLEAEAKNSDYRRRTPSYGH